MCFLIIDLDCALSSSVGSNWAHQALSQRPIHSYTQQLLSQVYFCVVNLPSLYCCFIILYSFLSVCFSFSPFLFLSCLSHNKDFSFGWNKTQWGSCQNKSLLVSWRKQGIAWKKRTPILFPPAQSINCLSRLFTSFHSCRTIGLINPSRKAHYPFPLQRCFLYDTKKTHIRRIYCIDAHELWQTIIEKWWLPVSF